jgi:hypothetical protein
MSERFLGFSIGTFASWIVFGFVGLGMWGCPRYHVWQQEMEGKAELAKADQNREIKVREARAKKEAATYEMEAEIIRATGASKANQIIDSSITQRYIQYLWVNGIQDNSNKIIYIPTEANLPILEARK